MCVRHAPISGVEVRNDLDIVLRIYQLYFDDLMNLTSVSLCLVVLYDLSVKIARAMRVLD